MSLSPWFRAIWLASLASNLGTWMQNVGAAWLMTSLTPSPELVALLQSAASLPVLLLGLPAGALADIVDRRRLLLVAQLWMLLVVAALAALTLLGVMTSWGLLLLTFLLGLGAALTAPAWQATIPDLVEPAQIPSAIALNSAGFNLARAVGPAVGGLVVAAAGPAAVFTLNALSFLGVLLVLRPSYSDGLPGARADHEWLARPRTHEGRAGVSIRGFVAPQAIRVRLPSWLRGPIRGRPQPIK